MSDTPPDRLATDPKSPHYDEQALGRGVGIRFNGREQTEVEEYCVSEGWIRTAVGKARDRRGRPMTLKLRGEVVPYFQDLAGTSDDGAAAGEPRASGGAAPDDAPR